MKSAAAKGLKICSAVLLGAALIAVVWIALRWDAPPLRIVGSATNTKIDVSTLGEYPTTVTRIRLSDAVNGNVIWEVESSAVAQFHGFTLKEGENAVNVDSDDAKYRVVVPLAATSFVLRKGVKYRLELWNGESIFNRSSAEFYVGAS